MNTKERKPTVVCPRCRNGEELFRRQRRWWMRAFVPQSRHLQCRSCNAAFLMWAADPDEPIADEA